ncbi:MAG TPA: biopolymer transporter ExbD [Candidatus Krumholzibacteria bacterium]|nr:biopolymer transporter ExbD [Candidatus Krumholzibacteria bacterium]
MIRRRRGRFQFGACEFQAASMSDLAFLLLVFFVVTTTFAVEEGIPLVLPGKAATTTRVDASDVLEIQALAGGRVEVQGQPVTLSDVRRIIEQRLRANPDLVVLLTTHRSAEYGLMVDLLDEIKLANCRRISLKTVE